MSLSITFMSDMFLYIYKQVDSFYYIWKQLSNSLWAYETLGELVWKIIQNDPKRKNFSIDLSNNLFVIDPFDTYDNFVLVIPSSIQLRFN